MKSLTVAFHHFGCKVNFAEVSTISRLFTAKGYRLGSFQDPADIYVISSCAVTAAAEKKCRAAIRQAHQRNPGAQIAVIGCLPELKANEIAEMNEVNVILGHTAKFNLPEEIEGQGSRVKGQGNSSGHRAPSSGFPGNSIILDPGSGIRDPASGFIPSYSIGDRTRSFLKIQDGCDYFCAYCAIPLARGKSRSDTIRHILEEAMTVVDSGAKEIVLTGVNIGDFGKHHGESLFQLMVRMEKEVPVPRIRISSIEPDLLSDEIIELVAGSDKFLPHFHIPLQSGSNKILRAMKRKYLRELYAERVERIRELMPFACIATDVIAGFPGETEADFRESCGFLEPLPVSYLHTFSYSRRDHTQAATMAGSLPRGVKKERSRIYHELSERKKQHFYHANKGRTAAILFESDNKEGMMHGFSDNYIKVKTPYNQGLVNEIKRVKLEDLNTDLCYWYRPENNSEF